MPAQSWRSDVSCSVFTLSQYCPYIVETIDFTSSHSGNFAAWKRPRGSKFCSIAAMNDREDIRLQSSCTIILSKDSNSPSSALSLRVGRMFAMPASDLRQKKNEGDIDERKTTHHRDENSRSSSVRSSP